MISFALDQSGRRSLMKVSLEELIPLFDLDNQDYLLNDAHKP